MAEQTIFESCNKPNSDDSFDQDDTLEAEISKLEATLNELNEDDLPELSNKAENLADDSYEESLEKTIMNIDFTTHTYKKPVESENNGKKQIWSGKDSHKTENIECSESDLQLHKSSEKEEKNTHIEVLYSDLNKSHKLTEPNIANVTKGADHNKNCDSTAESQKTSADTTSSECLSLFPSIDTEFEILLRSPGTEKGNPDKEKNYNLEFSPFRTIQMGWFTSSPKIINLVENQQSKAVFPSVQKEIQNALDTHISLAEHKTAENASKDLKIKEGNVENSELQRSEQKLEKDLTIQQIVKEPTGCNLVCNNNNNALIESLNAVNKNESSSCSLIILDEHIEKNDEFLKKASSESFLDLDVSQDYEKEWLNCDQVGNCGSTAGPVSSTPYRRGPLSFLKSKYLDSSYIVVDETGECDRENNDKAQEPPSTDSDVIILDEFVQEKDDQELNIPAKRSCTSVVICPLEPVVIKSNGHGENEVALLEEKKDKEGQIKIEVIQSDYLFKSEDPEENADNFNPEWELLRKLQTDEERYKAMRERWRNLVIPDPNQDLTHHTWRLLKNKSKILPSKQVSAVRKTTKPTTLSHKRSLSDPSSSSGGTSAKRSRTQSCTKLFDVKLQLLRQEINNEQRRLNCEEAQAVHHLRQTQAIQQQQLQHCYSGYQLMSQANLYHQYYQDEEMIRMQYEGARTEAENSKEKKIKSLEKASAEVRAFHKFYQGLENKEDNDKSAYLSETQLEELWETERFYEECEKFYG